MSGDTQNVQTSYQAAAAASWWSLVLALAGAVRRSAGAGVSAVQRVRTAGPFLPRHGARRMSVRWRARTGALH
ncbi:hypothetical protein Misp01_82460 [Microtetraspora sp. NBRC 13810]|nr:hypothetical protein Misp01_82460 [Microtetraspora sp. NBRC 13810]